MSGGVPADLFEMLKGLGGMGDPKTSAGGGNNAAMSQANAMWKMMDEMAESDPEQYKKYMQEQMQTAKKSAPQAVQETPTPSFCVRMRMEGGAVLFVNVGHHSRVKPPSSTPDGSVPLAVGVPREVDPALLPPPAPKTTDASFAVDVVVNVEVARKAAMDATYREELGSVCAQCARDTLSERMLLPKRLIAGYRVLPTGQAKIVGKPVAFADVRGGGGGGGGGGDSPADAAAEATGLPTSLFEQIAGMSGMGGGGGKGGKGGGGKGGKGGKGGPQGDAEEESVLDGGELRLPGSGARPPSSTPAASAGPACGVAAPASSSAAAAAKPKLIIEEISSAPAVAETPEHTLHDEVEASGWLRVTVQLPRIAAVAEIDLEMGETMLRLETAEGLYSLALPLPRAVDSDASKCKWDKKRRVLTVTMPVGAECLS